MKRNIILLTIILLSGLQTISAQEAKWIFYPGEFEIWAAKKISQQRTERNQPHPTMWRLDAPFGQVEFKKQMSLAKPEQASIWTDGKLSIETSKHGHFYDFDPLNFTLPAGEYEFAVRVENFEGLPSMLFKSESYVSDETWWVDSRNKDNVKASASYFTDPAFPPSTYALETEPIQCTILENSPTRMLVDFGKNTFGFPILHGIKGNGKIEVYYGESKEEALAEKLAETWEILTVNHPTATNDTLGTKAFRYIQIVKDPTVSVENISALYEYLPVDYRGSFTSSDELINRIYDVSMYTFHLTARECHLDGIKRDRWPWSGDALQSYLMNFYTFFDEDINKRTLWGLRGHEPFKTHINYILDYSFYWIIGVHYHYLYTADAEFVKQIYPRMVGTMDFCISRLNENGMAQGKPEDWVFVDWAPISKDGELSFEQFLFIQSLKAMKECADIAGDKTTSDKMQQLYDEKFAQFDNIFWSDKHNAFIHTRVDGKPTDDVTRYTNMFAILFDAVDNQRKQTIKESVILNNNILPITTPYMKFYELAALCEIGEQAQVLNFVKEYWGDMLNLGATTFWEAYDPTAPAGKHYEMYDRPFGKSLCHAWGANPVYLFGRYFMGVYPTAPGYKEYTIVPALGGLKWMKGAVPTPQGDIKVEMTQKKITVTPAGTGGTLKFKSKSMPKTNLGTIVKSSDNEYTLKLDHAGVTYEVTYK